jgi:Rrf2 family iron-sulfur cluster assembly transcriptional regulator
MAMTDLAGHEGERPVALAEVAERQQISLAYLEQLFSRLRRKGLVVSARGPGGGYRLAKPADETTIAEVIQAAGEPLRATRCAGGEAILGCLRGGARCLTHDLWEETGRRIEDYFASVSLADVLNGRLHDQPTPVRAAASARSAGLATLGSAPA